jgi:hypothetical protein
MTLFIDDLIHSELELDEYVLDNSALSAFAHCPRRFLYVKVLSLRSRVDALALSFGGAFHAGLAEYYTSGEPVKALRDFAEAATAERSRLQIRIEEAKAAGIKEEYSLEFGMQLLTKYMLRYPRGTDGFQIMVKDGTPLVEQGFTLRLGNGLIVGKMDGVIDDGDLLEHKTTSQYLSPEFLSQYIVHNQITLYMAALRELLGRMPKKCIVNIIRVKEYKTVNKDDKLFSRQYVTRTTAQLDQFLQQLEFRISQVKNFLRIGFDAFYQNAPEACTKWGRICEYMPLCQAQDSDSVEALINGGGYVVEAWEPFDLKGAKSMVALVPKTFEA